MHPTFCPCFGIGRDGQVMAAKKKKLCLRRIEGKGEGASKMEQKYIQRQKVP